VGERVSGRETETEPLAARAVGCLEGTTKPQVHRPQLRLPCHPPFSANPKRHHSHKAELPLTSQPSHLEPSISSSLALRSATSIYHGRLAVPIRRMPWELLQDPGRSKVEDRSHAMPNGRRECLSPCENACVVHPLCRNQASSRNELTSGLSAWLRVLRMIPSTPPGFQGVVACTSSIHRFSHQTPSFHNDAYHTAW
jgi:hypothetical protein